LEIFDDAQATYEPSTETLEQCIDIFSTFANLDTMRIFLLAEKGISNSNKAIKELDLTPKRYYSRLKALVDSGVLEKVNGVYLYTPVGELLHSLGLSLINLVNNKQKIGLLLNLSKSDALSDEERQKINSMIVGNTDVGKMLGSMIKGVPQEKTIKISEYKTLVETLAHAIASSKKSILLASRYFDIWVVDECLKAQERGNELRILLSKETMSKKMNMLRMMLSPKLIMKVLEISNEKNINDILREIELPFSFCIIDGSECFFEFPSVGGEFSIAFKLKDNETSKKFTQLFNSAWESRDVNKTSTLQKEISE
jgi:predicted transcriptional regulator